MGYLYLKLENAKTPTIPHLPIYPLINLSAPRIFNHSRPDNFLSLLGSKAQNALSSAEQYLNLVLQFIDPAVLGEFPSPVEDAEINVT